MSLSCSCPDWDVPRKHLAAKFYLLAERVDDDPFAILLWRGRSRTALLNRLRELRGGDASHHPVEPEGPTTEALRPEAMMALATWSRPMATSGPGAPIPALPVHPELPTDLLLRQLPVPGAPLGGLDLVTYLEPLYAVLGMSPDDG